MALKAVVKVSSVTNLSDARYCAGMGVDMLGFDINPSSEEYINPLKFQEITGWVAGVKLVGETHGMSEEEIRSQLVQYELDVLEISDLSLLPALQHTDLTFIVKVKSSADVDKAIAICKDYSAVDHIFIELEAPINLEQIKSTAENNSILVGYDVTPANADTLITAGSVAGLVLKGSQELKPGFKDYDELADILEALEVED